MAQEQRAAVPVHDDQEVVHGVVLDDVGLQAVFGIADLAAIEGTEDRIVRLSPDSSLLCPTHGRELRPDACRTCAMFARGVERLYAKPSVA